MFITYGTSLGGHLVDTGLSWSEDLTETEVDDLDVTLRVLGLVEEVLWLEISVNDALGMAVVNTKHQLFEAVSGLLLGVALLLDNLVEHLTTSAQLGNNVEVFIILEVLVELQDMWVIKLCKDTNLSMELCHVLDLLLGNGLAGSVLLGDSMSALADDTEGASTEGLLAHLVDFFELVVILVDECLFLDKEIGVHNIFFDFV